LIKIWETLITDVDGVLTTGRYLYNSSGKQYKEFGPHDADAIKFLRFFGVKVVAISADSRGFEITKKRLSDMGVELHLVKENNRKKWIETNISSDSFGFVGDGYFDIPAHKLAKYSYAPRNSLEVVKKNSDIVLDCNGGDGVLWSVFEHFLENSSHELFLKLKKGELNYEGNN